MVALGERKRKDKTGKETDGGSGEAVRFSFFIWVLVTQLSLVYKNSLNNILMIYYSVNGFRNPGTCCSEETYPSIKEAGILKSKDGKNDQGITN